MEKQAIAFIGLGKMGAAMAANIQRAGYPLTVWNRSSYKMESFAKSGAKLAESPAAAVAGADFIISSLADDASVRAVVSEPNGLLSGMKPGAIHIGTSTISPRLADELEMLHTAAGQHYIAGPVVGRVPSAEAGKLITLLAGAARPIEAAQSLITTYAYKSIVIGERQSLASTAKLMVNFLGASAMDLMGQTITWAERAGIPAKMVYHMLSSFFANPATQDYILKIGQRDFDTVGFTSSGGLKDVNLMIDSAHDVKLTLSSAQALRVKLEQAITHGWQNRDWSCFTEIDRNG
ncbi:MAG: NAD(P)-dependent oxidoreductase [Burkholderiaceae bacterium]|jgi:3-hydroxyisobutyrate dehydrogenase-like beta-hydroxyacid dehydrogenase|nr:NAD(P)-dependent oxidoreductase [Burkholderiaceae bacterium]